MQVRKLAGALGAEISGIDLARGMSREQAAALRGALNEHLVIFLHEQDLSPQQFLDFANAMGEPIEYPFVKGLDGYPTIIEVKKLETERVNFRRHLAFGYDVSRGAPDGFDAALVGDPPYGGDTLFANQQLAYDALSDTMKRLLEGLKGINSSAKADVSRTREDRIRTDGRGEKPKDLVSLHPIVRTHPESGRKSLYVNVAHTVGIDGMTSEESALLLDFLFWHQVKPEFTCRFAWTPNAVAFWDNRSAQHNPVNDYHGFRRVIHRITLKGDVPR